MNLDPLISEIESSEKAVHSLLIEHPKTSTQEFYFRGKGPEDLQNLYSCTKSISSLLVGIALDQNPSVGLKTPVLEIFPDLARFAEERAYELTLEHFLNQTTGFKWMETGRAFAKGHSGFDMEQTGNWSEFLFSQPLTSKPGQRFNYNTGVSHILPLLAGRIANVDPRTFFETQLAKPLGFESYQWQTDPQGNLQGGKGLFLRPKDLLKVGKLILSAGLWGETQIVSADWIKKATSPQSRGHIYYGTYGFQWWLKNWEEGPKVRETEHNIICAIGFGGQFLFVVPAWDLVVVFTGQLIGAENFEYPQKLFREHLLPLFA